jgi:hypothetical protein
LSLCLYSNLYGKFEIFDSTISHIGFILLSLAIASEQSIESILFYIIQYSIANLDIFLILIALSYLIYNSILKKTFVKVTKTNNYLLIIYSLLQRINSVSKLLELIFIYIKLENLIKILPEFILLCKNTKIKNFNKEIKKGIIDTDIKYISEIKNQFLSNPLISLSLSICLFSMAGIKTKR